MSLPPRLVTFLLVLAALLALGGGTTLGMTLGERASRPGHSDLVIENPALATAGSEAMLHSPGGFTGFDGPGSLGGAAVRVGTVATPPGAPAGTFEVNSQGSSLGIRTTSTARLFRLRRVTAPLRPGDAVMVRVGGDGAATAVLRVPRDLNEGAGRPSPTPSVSGTPGTTGAGAAATSTPAR